MRNYLYLPILISIIIIKCSTTPFSMDTIMFDNMRYSQTKASKIKIYESRLDIPYKYYEIGTIKYQGEPVETSVKKLAAKKGADALILDGNNYILIKTNEDKEELEKPNENQSI